MQNLYIVSHSKRKKIPLPISNLIAQKNLVFPTKSDTAKHYEEWIELDGPAIAWFVPRNPKSQEWRTIVDGIIGAKRNMGKSKDPLKNIEWKVAIHPKGFGMEYSGISREKAKKIVAYHNLPKLPRIGYEIPFEHGQYDYLLQNRTKFSIIRMIKIQWESSNPCGTKKRK